MQKNLRLDEEKLKQSKGHTTLYGTVVVAESPPDCSKELEERAVCLKVTGAVLFLCMVAGLLIAALLGK